MNDTTPTPDPTDVEALLARALVRHFHPERVQMRWNRKTQTEEVAHVWDENDQPYIIFTASDGERSMRVATFRELAAALLPWVAQQRADALREAADAAEIQWTTQSALSGPVHVSNGTARWLRARADRIAPTTEET